MKLQLNRFRISLLTLPTPITVFADQTAGKVVSYVATAVDNLPGPVDFSCDIPSGSLFPNGKNAPLTTTVTCTAKDAVLNTSVGSFTVTVVSPSGYIPDFVILGREWVSLSSSVIVQTGNIGVRSEHGRAEPERVRGRRRPLGGLPGPVAGRDAQRSDRVLLAGDVFYVDQFVSGNQAVLTAKVGYVPLFFNMPAVPVFAADEFHACAMTARAGCEIVVVRDASSCSIALFMGGQLGE